MKGDERTAGIARGTGRQFGGIGELESDSTFPCGAGKVGHPATE